MEQERYYKAKQKYQFDRAALGDERFQVEELRLHHGDDSPEFKAALHDYDCNVYRVEGGIQPQGCPPLSTAKPLKALFLDTEDELLAAQKAYDALLAAHKAAEADLAAANAAVTQLDKRIDAIAPGFFNDNFRDAPLLDFLVPTLKVKQVVIADIRDDYNFATVQKEDRCMTCHLGIDKRPWAVHAESQRFEEASTRAAAEAEVVAQLLQFIKTQVPQAERAVAEEEVSSFQDSPEVTLRAWFAENLAGRYDAFTQYAKEPLETLRVRTQTYKAHPKLDLYMTSASPHPIEAFGCSVCHEGRGHATEFNRVFHTPQNPEQAAQWHEDYGWHEPHYWDYPQLPADRVTASCGKCHDSAVTVQGGGDYNEGKRLVEKVGCFGCHRIEGLTGVLRKVGPSLERVASKVDQDFAYAWIWDPKSFRPTTKMPRFFGLSNNSHPAALAMTQQEARSIVAYLYANQQPFEVGELPTGDSDIAHGKTLFREVGCLGCHSMTAEKLTANNHGPDLMGVGSKLSQAWIYQWLKNPRAYFEKTHMPSLRLSDREALDISGYLASLKNSDWQPTAMPSRDDKIQDLLIRQSLGTAMRRSEVDTLLADMSLDEREVLLGQKSIAKYGCAGCHDIKGFENAGPIGTELTTWGDKFITQLDFGLISHHGVDAEVQD
ncbi:MAG: c-type cytochrome, partial [Myxococcota bacterium]